MKKRLEEVKQRVDRRVGSLEEQVKKRVDSLEEQVKEHRRRARDTIDASALGKWRARFTAWRARRGGALEQASERAAESRVESGRLLSGYRILFIGDSLIAGVGVSGDEAVLPRRVAR